MSVRRSVPVGRYQRLRDSVRTLHPGYFALVMATGIVSVGLRDRVPALSAALMWLTAAAYLVLVILYLWRVAAFGKEMRRDLVDPARGFAFFTFTAGTDVLGTRLAAAGHLGTAMALLVVGGVGWLVLGYLIPWTAAFGGVDRPIVAVANGTWFIWVVASQSVAVLTATIQPTVGAGRDELALVAVCCWSIGAFLYAAVGLLAAARLLLYDIRPADLTPPYWVAMGATAITVLAGARVVRMPGTPAATHDLIAGAAVLFWAFGSWLVPPLLAAGWWRHVRHRVPLPYDAAWWSIVFPLGMYGVASRALGEATQLPLIATVGWDEVWVSLAAWAAAFVAMLVHLARTLLRPGRPT